MLKVFAFSTLARPRVSQCCAAHLISGNGCSGNEGRPKTPSHKRNRGRLAEEDGKQVLRGAVVFTRCTRNAVFELPRAEGVDPLLVRLQGARQTGRKRTMSNYTHETVPTQFVEANGIRYAYRRFGQSGAIPLLLLGYFNS